MRLRSLKRLLIENQEMIYEKAVELTEGNTDFLVGIIENSIKFTAESACIFNDEKAILEYLFLIMENENVPKKRTVKSNDIETIIIDTLRKFIVKQILCFLLVFIIIIVISFGGVFIWRKIW